MAYTVEQLKDWAAEGVAAWQASMPPGVTFGAVVPDVDAVYFTVTQRNQGTFIQVPAVTMNNPETWQSAAARLLGAVHRDQLQLLNNGEVPLLRLSLSREQPSPLDLNALLADAAVREVVRAEISAGMAALRMRRNGLWYLNPAFGPNALVQRFHVNLSGQPVRDDPASECATVAGRVGV